MSGPKIVDVHTHIYNESYLELLRTREEVPFLKPGAPGKPERLIILPGEDKTGSTSSGRPVGPEYSQLKEKIAFMDRHDIDISVISLANPWLDWLSNDSEAEAEASKINDELVQWCESPEAQGRLYAFGVLPTHSVAGCVKEIERIAKQPKYIKGVIIGTLGAGKGLDDPELDPMWKALEKSGFMAFVHPHYHLPNEVYGEQENGHVLPLAFGFPVETSLAIARLILAGVLERFPDLKLLIAHSGGVLPFLAGRLDSCVIHDAHVSKRLPHPPTYYLGKLYYDAVSYQPASLNCLKGLLGGVTDKVMFDPFFPPLSESGATGPDLWESCVSNKKAIAAAFSESETAGVLGGNAIKILGL